MRRADHAAKRIDLPRRLCPIATLTTQIPASAGIAAGRFRQSGNKDPDVMNTHQNATPQNVPAVITDGFSDTDPTASPLRGTSIRFKDGAYESFGEAIDVEDTSYAVIDRVQGWQKLQRDCPPEYLVRATGEPKPAQPFVDKKDWPLDLNGNPSHPWKWTHYLYLLDTSTGEFSTFWSNTIGGNVAIGELSDQVSLMRNVRPGAIPVVALRSKMMPTQFGGDKPRPHFKILGWKAHGSDQTLLAAPEQNLIDVEKPSLKEQMGGDEVPFNDPLPDLGAKKKKK
jgi:hypothetical protein